MESKRLSIIDKAFLVVIAGVLALGVLVQAGYSFSGEDNTFGIDSTGEGYIEVHDVNISRDWFRGLVNVTDNILGVLGDLIPDAADTYDIGSATAEWEDLYIGTGRVYFWTDQDEWIYSNDDYLIVGVDGVHSIELDASAIRPVIPDALSLGGTLNEWEDLYIGTGRAYFYTDQGESIRSNGVDLIFAVGNADKYRMTETVIRATIANQKDLGGVNYEWHDLYIGSGKVYFWVDQGESIESDGNNLLIDGSNGVLPAGGNNTGAIGSDSVRWANGWFTTMTAKSLVTGKVIEKELKPFPGESFEEGDVVKIYDSNYFVKSNKVLDHVVGVVVNNPEQIIVDYNVSWEMVPREIPVTQEVEYVLNKMDAYGNRFEVIELRIENVYEYYLNPVKEKLLDGSTVTVYYNESRIVHETIWENVTTENPIFGEMGNPVLCVAGKARVKISESVLKNDILVAGQNGKARPFRTVLTQIKAQYSGIPFNWNNVITVMEAFNLRMLGQVMEDSNGDYAQVMLW